MAKQIRRINYRKMYPEANDAIIEVLEKSDRKMEYQQYDLKVERYHISSISRSTIFVPSREDSYERLTEANHQFVTEGVSVEDSAINTVLIEKMISCLKLLSDEEQKLINELFYNDKSERQYSRETGIPQRTIHDRKVKILKKIKKSMNL